MTVIPPANAIAGLTPAVRSTVTRQTFKVSKKRAPTRAIEQQMWARGHDVVVGIDEVGRGAWAGPLMVGAAVLPRDTEMLKCVVVFWLLSRVYNVLVASAALTARGARNAPSTSTDAIVASARSGETSSAIVASPSTLRSIMRPATRSSSSSRRP